MTIDDDGWCAMTAAGQEQKRLLACYRPTGAALNCVAWSPDGSLLAVASNDKTVRVLSANGDELCRLGGHDMPVWCVVFSPDGRRIASGAWDRTIRLWDGATGRQLACYTGHQKMVSAVLFSPDQRIIASASMDKTIRLWDVASGRCTVVLNGHQDWVSSLAASADFRRLASGSDDRTILVWDGKTGAQIACLSGHWSGVWSLAYSADGTQMASGSIDETIRLWDANTGAELGRLTGHDETVRAVAFAPSGRHLASGGEDHTVRLWDLDSKTELACLKHHHGLVRSVAFSPDGRRLASVSYDGALCLWDTSDLVKSGAAAGNATPLAAWLRRQAATLGLALTYAPAPAPDFWAPDLQGADGKRLLAVMRPDNPGELAAGGIALSPDGLRLYRGTADGRVEACCLRTGKLLWSVLHHEGTVWDLCLSPDGRRLAAGSADTTISILDCRSGDKTAHLAGHADSVLSVAFHPDGCRLASGSSDNTVRQWAYQTGAETTCITAQHDWAFCVAFSPDGNRLASAAQNSGIWLWDVNAAGKIASIGAGSEGVLSIAHAPDGRSIASATSKGKLQLWDAATHAEIARFVGHTDRVYCIAFSADGRYLVSGGGNTDRTIRVWDCASGGEIDRWDFPEQYCWRLAWSASGAFIVAAMYSDTIRIFDNRKVAMVATAAATATATATATAAATASIEAAAPRPRQDKPCPPRLARLADDCARLHQLDVAAPLSLLDDLRGLLLGQAPESLLPLLGNPGVQALRGLRWPGHAHAGLLALLLHGWPGAREWQAPNHAHGSAGLRAALVAALADGKPDTLTVAASAAAPLAWLTQALRRVDARLLTLLSALGPQAVANDPGLPLRLLPQVPYLPALTEAQRQLLTSRLAPLESGPAQGGGAGQDRSGFTSHGTINALLPSQWAYPRRLLYWRHVNGGLLYRTHSGREAPQLRPMVIVLDTSPACWGLIEALTRPAAHALAQSLARQHRPAVLLTAGDNAIHSLDRPDQRLQVLTHRSRQPVDIRAALAKAQALRNDLDAGPVPALVLLLTHCWWGADLDDFDAIAPQPGLRALFVQYPRTDIDPPFARHCERWQTVRHDQIGGLASVLGKLIG